MPCAVCFENTGLLDPRAITVLGINVKESPNAIGYFGTGLKYAIAVLLREGCSITIMSGGKQYNFRARRETVRGEDFDIIYMNDERLGFTTDLGKNWEVWMAYRELYCNAKDEPDCQIKETRMPSKRKDPPEGKTRIYVEGDKFLKVHRERHKFILESAPLYAVAGANIHRGSTKTIFYKGIKVGELPTPSRYTYDIIQKLSLTEDRTVDSFFTVFDLLGSTLRTIENRAFLREVLSGPPQSSFERDFDFCALFGGNGDPSDAFCEIAFENEHRLNAFNQSAVAIAKRYTRKSGVPGDPVQLTSREEKMLNRAEAFLAPLGYIRNRYDIVVVESLGSGCYGCAVKDEQTIVLSRHTFDMGTKYVASTLYEEFVHLYHGADDCTRELQNHLLDKLMSMVEEINGEPL